MLLFEHVFAGLRIPGADYSAGGARREYLCEPQKHIRSARSVEKDMLSHFHLDRELVLFHDHRFFMHLAAGVVHHLHSVVGDGQQLD